MEIMGLNPRPLACEANVLTIQLQPLLIETKKSSKVILLCLHSYKSNFCQKNATFYFKYFNRMREVCRRLGALQQIKK